MKQAKTPPGPKLRAKRERRRERWKQRITVLQRLLAAIDRDCVFVYAGQASFMLVIAMFPFAMLLFSLLQYVLPFGRAELAKELEQMVPSMIMAPVSEVLDELFARPTISLISVTAVTALWTASRGINAVKNGLRRMYHTPANRGFLYNTAMSLFYTVTLLVALFATLILLVFGKLLMRMLQESFPWTAHLVTLLVKLRSLISLTLLTLFFMIVYRTLPGQKLSFVRQFPGALFTAVGWIGFSLAFSIYIENFGHYSFVYGGLTAVVLIMLWLYACMAILLIGAEINAFLLRHVLKRPHRGGLRRPAVPTEPPESTEHPESGAAEP